MIGRLASAYFWGVTADRYGRRPVILFSLGSTSVFAVAFGVSETFLWALTCRCGPLDGVRVFPWSLLLFFQAAQGVATARQQLVFVHKAFVGALKPRR